MIFVRKGHQLIMNYINSGNLDYLLLKPISIRSIMPFIKFDFRHFLPAIAMSLLILAKLVAYNLSLFDYMFIIFYTVVGIIITYELTSIFITTGFWAGRNDAIFNFKIELPDLIKLPMDFYSGIFSTIFTVVIPIALILNPIFQIIQGTVDANFLIFTIIYTIIISIFAEWFWKFGLKHYTSAN